MLKQLAKNVLIPLGLTAAPSATNAAIQNKTFGSGTITLKFRKKMNNIIKIAKPLEESSLLITSIGKTDKNEAREQNKYFSALY